MRRLGRLIRAGVLVWFATFVAVFLAELLWPTDPPFPARADAIFCLGAGMEEDPSPLPDPVTEGRAQTCVTLFQEGVAPVIVFTGAGNDTHSASSAMVSIARQAGLPEDAILEDPLAHSTLQNAAFGLALLPEAPERIVLVSDRFHLPRAWVIFRVLGPQDVSLYPTSETFIPPITWRALWSARESLALWFNVGRLSVYTIAGWVGFDRDTRISWFN